MMHMRTSVAGHSLMLALACTLGATFPGYAAAQSVSGRAFGASVDTPLANAARSVVATLPGTPSPTGDLSTAESDGLSVPNALSASFLNSTATGAIGGDGASAQTVATVADVEILGGLIQAAELVAVAASSRDASGAASSARGSTFENLVVRGVTMASGDEEVAPNTRVSLPGVGYVVLNEQRRSGDGRTSSGITVNMIHVVLTNALTGAKVGDIVVGSASSAVR